MTTNREKKITYRQKGTMKSLGTATETRKYCKESLKRTTIKHNITRKRQKKKKTL